MLLSTTFALLLSLVFPTCTSDTKGIYFACYDRADKGRSDIGLHSLTVSGARCLPHKGSNFCRNFNESEERPWCLVSDQRKICKVDECDGVSISLSSANITLSDVKDNRIVPGLAVNGNLRYDNGNCFHSALNERSAWWKVDLGKEIVTSEVAFQLFVPANESRPKTVLVKVFVNDGNFQACGNAVTEFESPISIVYRSCGSTGIRGRYVDIESLMNNHNKSILNLCEVQVNRVERQSCRWNKLLWEKNDTFSVVGKGDTLQVKCKDGYWPTQVQNLRCNPSGEWSHFSCKKVGILPWRTVEATARMAPSALKDTTVASKAIDGVIPNATGAGDGFLQCTSTHRTFFTRWLNVTFPTVYLVISVQLFLRDNDRGYNRQSWQNGLQVLAVERSGAKHQCGTNYNSATHGQNPIFTCASGIVSDSVLLRLQSGSRQLQVCEMSVTAVIGCGKPPFVDHALLSYDNSELNSNATYACEDGYVLLFNPVVRCLTNGSWSQPLPSCAKGCKYPIADDSKGCRVVGNKKKFNYSDTVKIGRKRGYCIAKDITMKCSSDGTWSPKAPECKPIRCPKPISPLHGKLSWGGDLLVGAWATFSCESGYDLNKNRTLSNYATRCTQSGNRKICDGVWSPKKPCCTPRSCDDPKTSNFKNGSIIGDAYFYPETIKLNCWEGYELVGDTSLFQCNHEGKWVEINESQVEDHAVVSQRVNDERKHAKECFGSNKTVTLPEVTNIRSFPTCEPKNCGRPAVHENCTASGNYFQYQGMVSYGRKPGFCLSGSDKIFCTASGVWSNTLPVCKRIRCPLLKLPSHGRIVIERTEYYVDDQADFICDSGYDLNMDRSIQSLTLRCQQSNDILQCQGSWSKRPPCCIPRACPHPFNSGFANGTIQGGAFFFPERISLKCNKGHKLTENGPVYQCNKTGDWVHLSNPLPEDGAIVLSRIEAAQSQMKDCPTDHSAAKPSVQSILPSCKPVYCGPPDSPKNGSYSGNYFHFPGSISYACDRGFCIKGSTTSTCTANEAWSNQPPTCSPVVCPELQNPKNGTVELKSARVGETATYRCLSGYDLNGNLSLTSYTSTCLQNLTTTDCIGTWSGSKPTCKPKTCSGPRQGLNVTIYSDVPFEYPLEVEISCKEGYEVQGGFNKWKCSKNSMWYNEVTGKLSNEIPFCTPKECGYPNVPANCAIVGINRTFHYGETVTFTRKEGYCRNGKANVHCTADGTWSRTPTCTQIECDNLPIPPHSRIHRRDLVNKLNVVDTLIDLTCHSGYEFNKNRLLSNYTIQCTQPKNEKKCTGTWKPNLPCCTPRSCADPNTSNFRNGAIIGKAYFYPETIKLNCFEGHELKGATPFFRCNHEGKWVEINENEVESEDVVRKRVKEERERAKHCFNKSETIVTLPEITHIRTFPTCEPKNCGRPVMHENCTAIGNYFQYPGVVSYDRKRGFCLSGSQKISCNSSGIWSSASPVCKRIECPLLDAPSHGRISFERTEYHVDDIANYTCDPGYDLNMDRSIQSLTVQCQQPDDIFQCQGSWSERSPCCIPRACPSPFKSGFANGTVEGDSYFFPERISLICDKGHNLTGSGPVYQCNETGSWVHLSNPPPEDDALILSRIDAAKLQMKDCPTNHSAAKLSVQSTLPSCEPLYCGPPNSPNNGSYSGNYFHFPGSISYECDRGFCLGGSQNLSCNSSGVWSGDPPVCKRIRCPILDPPSNGNIAIERHVDSIANYTCDSGYDLNMDRNIEWLQLQCMQPDDMFQCLGSWSGPPPCCVAKACPNPENSNFRNGTIEGDAYFFPERIFLNCTEGHTLTHGGPVYQCSETGTWVHLPNPSPENDTRVQSRISAEKAKTKSCPSVLSRGIMPGQAIFPTCQPVNCKKPAVPQNGSLFGNYYQYPGIVTFSCSSGFCLQGENLTTCNSTGQWSNPSPTCRRVVCPELVVGLNMQVELPDERFVGLTARYFPDPGYSLNGSVYTKCFQADDIKNCQGYWSPSRQTAEPKRCGDPGPLENGYYSLLQNSTVFRAKVEYRCLRGYELKDGYRTRMCDHTGQWSGIRPRCQHVCVDVSPSCSSSQICTVNREGKGECSCLPRTDCPSDLNPICATDTKTYNNRCQMKIAGCIINGKNDSTEVASLGQCQFAGSCFGAKPRPPPGKVCREYLYRYFYNNESGRCERFAYGSCHEGRNVFYTEHDCDNECVRTSPCSLDVDPGLCEVPQQRFFYNATIGNCTEFTYHGCYGNQNNFPSRSTCETRCSGYRVTPPPPVVPKKNITEKCCPNVIKNRCNTDLVLNIDPEKKETEGKRIRVGVKFAPRSLEGTRPKEYREVRWIILPRVPSKVKGCSMKCPKFSADGDYLVLVRNVELINDQRVSAEKYHVISYEKGQKQSLLAELEKCKSKSKDNSESK